VAELYTWAYIQEDPSKILNALEVLFEYEVTILPYDQACAEEFGKLRGTLRRSGIVVSPFDLLIASVALTHDLTMVTNNVRDFEKVPNLQVVDWLKPD